MVLVLDQWQEGHVNAAPARFIQEFKGETMNHEKLRTIVDQIGPKANPEIDRDLEILKLEKELGFQKLVLSIHNTIDSITPENIVDQFY